MRAAGLSEHGIHWKHCNTSGVFWLVFMRVVIYGGPCLNDGICKYFWIEVEREFQRIWREVLDRLERFFFKSGINRVHNLLSSPVSSCFCLICLTLVYLTHLNYPLLYRMSCCNSEPNE